METQQPQPTEERTVSFFAANMLAGIVMIPLIALVAVPYVLVHGGFALFEGFVALFTPIWLFLLVLVASVFIHEGLHGFGWAVLGKAGWVAMKFGVKQMTPYAHCKIPLDAASYRIGRHFRGWCWGYFRVPSR